MSSVEAQSTVVVRDSSKSPPLAGGDHRGKVWEEIGRLHAQHQAVLLLKVRHGKSYKEIASLSGLSVANVGHLLHHAMKELSARLGGAGEVTS